MDIVAQIMAGAVGTAPIAALAVKTILKRLRNIEIALVSKGIMTPEQVIGE